MSASERRKQIAALAAVYAATQNENTVQHAKRVARINFGVPDLHDYEIEDAIAELQMESLRAARALGLDVTTAQT